MSDPLRDPDFYPQRPQSQDFWRLSEIVLWMDGKTEDEGFNFEAFLKEAADPEALLYMAEQRGFRSVLAAVEGGKLNASPTAAWLDGFLVGYRFFQKYAGDADGP